MKEGRKEGKESGSKRRNLCSWENVWCKDKLIKGKLNRCFWVEEGKRSNLD